MIPELDFFVTPYQGYEEEVLRIRNRNREIRQNRKYLDWRYIGQKTDAPPEIFWIRTSTGAFIGMASLIYRSYWLNNQRHELMILGDISLDKEYRGRGLADRFFLYINNQIGDKATPCALVIPNTPAEKVLARCGWSYKDKIVHHVLLLNPEKKISSIIKINLLSKVIGRLYRYIISKKLNAVRTKGLSVNHITEFGADLDVLWNTLDKENLCLRDRSRESLLWRYADRPGNESFSVAMVYKRHEPVGYIVYLLDTQRRGVTVYELVVTGKRYVAGLIRLLVEYFRENLQVDFVRIALNESHPYADQLSGIGFSRRKGGQAVLLLDTGNNIMAGDTCQWFLTAGDKDV